MYVSAKGNKRPLLRKNLADVTTVLQNYILQIGLILKLNSSPQIYIQYIITKIM